MEHSVSGGPGRPDIGHLLGSLGSKSTDPRGLAPLGLGCPPCPPPRAGHTHGQCPNVGEDRHACLHGRMALPGRVAAELAQLRASHRGHEAETRADRQTKPGSSTCYLWDTWQVP